MYWNRFSNGSGVKLAEQVGAFLVPFVILWLVVLIQRLAAPPSWLVSTDKVPPGYLALFIKNADIFKGCVLMGCHT